MFQGSIVALPTFFTDQNEVDFQILQELIDFHVEAGTDAVVVCGSTGEASTLQYEEQLRIFREAVSIARGRIPIIAGTGSNNTHHAIELTQEAKKAGCDAALVIVPYYNRPTPEGCFLHYQEIAKVGLPMIVYYHPSRTAVRLPVVDLARIAELPNVVGIKDGSGDLDYVIELMQATRTPVFCGDDPLILPMMASGARGMISIVANLIPREWKILSTLLLSDQIDEARTLFRRYYSLAKAMVIEINPQCIKFAMSASKQRSAKMRLPLIEPQPSTQLKILEELSKVESAGITTSVGYWG